MHGWPRKVYSQLSHELKWSDTNELILLYVRTRMYVLLCLAENEALQCCSKGCYTLRCLPWLHAMLTSASAVGTQRCLMNNSCVVGGEGWLWTVQQTQVNLKGWSLPIEVNIVQISLQSGKTTTLVPTMYIVHTYVHNIIHRLSIYFSYTHTLHIGEHLVVPVLAGSCTVLQGSDQILGVYVYVWFELTSGGIASQTSVNMYYYYI